jgi:hypothetical protein
VVALVGGVRGVVVISVTGVVVVVVVEVVVVVVDVEVEVDVVVGATVVVVVSNGAVFSIATADNELAPARATTMATIVAAGPVGFLI